MMNKWRLEEVPRKLIELCFPHDHYQKAYKGCWGFVQIMCPGNMAVLSGVAGTGKTTLIKQLVNNINKEANSGKYRCRAILVNAPVQSKGQDYWDAFEATLYLTLNRSGGQKRGRREAVRYARRTGRHMLTNAVENALQYRGVEVIVIDEAYRFLMGSSWGEANQITEKLKDFCERNELKIIFVGAQGILKLVNTNTQISRRIKTTITLGAYSITRKSERTVYYKYLHSLEKYLPLHKDVSLVRIAELLHVRTSGRVGRVSDVVASAALIAWNQDQTVIKEKDLIAALPGKKELADINGEIGETQNRMNDIEYSDDQPKQASSSSKSGTRKPFSQSNNRKKPHFL